MSSPEAAGPRPSRPNVWKLTWRFLRLGRPYWKRILLTIGVCLVASAAKAGQTAIIGPFIDNATAQGPRAEQRKTRLPKFVVDRIGAPSSWRIDTLAKLAVGASLLMFGFGWLKDYLTNFMTGRILADLRNRVAGHLSFLPLRYHYDRKSGDLVSRVTNDVAVTESAANFIYDDLIGQPITAACALGLIFWSNWRLAAIMAGFFLFYVLVLGRLSRAMRKARKKSLEHLGDMTGTMLQTFGGIKVVKAFNMEAEQAREFEGHNENYFRKFMRAVGRKALGENIAQIFIGVAMVALLVGGWQMLQSGALQPGDMAVMGVAVAMVNGAVKELAKSYNRLVEASAGCERVFELLDQPRETEHDGGVELPAAGDGVEFRRVTFGYDRGEPVLRDVSLRAAPGEVVAVVGRTGSGKTTLCDLLCRFYDPQEGAVIVHGADLRTVRRSSLLSRIAVVTQDPFLFNTTLRENIRYGRRDATPAEIEAAAKAAHIHDFIAGLPQGYETVVGERGAKLSGGQRQRVTIARAILRNPAILILDEATSALDAESEKAVQEALDALIHSARRITFVIAHRLSTIRDADRILVLDAGRLAEQGRHEDLLARGGLYASLYQTQFAS
jgi:subfamily B ATP-binding cassette protein MsbA